MATINVLHVAARSLPLWDALSDDFEYDWLPDDTGQPVADQPLFLANGQFNPRYFRAIILLDATSPWLDQPERLRALPANQIICDVHVALPDAALEILNLKNVFFFDFTDVKGLAHDLNVDFFDGQHTFGMGPQFLRLDPTYRGPLRQEGGAYRVFTAASPDWVRVAALPNPQYVPANFDDHLTLEYVEQPGQAELMMAIDLLAEGAPTQRIKLTGDQLHEGYHLLAEAPTGFNVSFYIRGTGEVKLGKFHVRRSRGRYGEVLLNSVRLLDPASGHGGIIAYFDAGDLKPPLNVFFSGFRGDDGFEGRGMMSRLGAPHLLITDTRLMGGGFYIGSPAFEQAVLDLIKQTLKRLHFTPDQLTMGGMSMGTYAAFYYGAQLPPRAIFAGKPLTNLGAIAKAGKILRPGDFEASFDVQLYYEGDLSTASSEHLNQRLWQQFDHADFSRTTFAIAYMREDGFDTGAFKNVYDRIKERFPDGHFLYKGISGRHNDDTPAIVAWYTLQLRHFLAHEFDRPELEGGS